MINQQHSKLTPNVPGGLQHFLREAYYKAVPSSIRSFLNGKNRDAVFRNALAIFLKNPAACATPGNQVLIDLIYGWGNEAWSAREEYLAACITAALTTEGPVLECGSGLSTVLIGAIAKQRGLCHCTLEHKPEWAGKVQDYLNDYGFDTLILSSPLKNYGGFDWYDIRVGELPTGFNLIVCDGPPSRTKGGRYGLLPVLKPKFGAGSVILLDDGYRKDELDIARRWQAETPLHFEVQGTIKPYIKIVLS